MYGYHNMIVDKVFSVLIDIQDIVESGGGSIKSTLHSNHLEVAMGHSSTPLHSAIIGDQEKGQLLGGRVPSARGLFLMLRILVKVLVYRWLLEWIHVLPMQQLSGKMLTTHID